MCLEVSSISFNISKGLWCNPYFENYKHGLLIYSTKRDLLETLTMQLNI